MKGFLYIRLLCLFRPWTFSWTSPSFSPNTWREKSLSVNISSISSDAGGKSLVFWTSLALLWAGKGGRSRAVGRAPGPPEVNTCSPRSLFRALQDLWETRQVRQKGLCFILLGFWSILSQLHSYWVGKLALKLFKGGANKRYSCFVLNGFWGSPGQFSPLAVDTFTSFASGFCKQGEVPNLDRCKGPEEA